MVIGFFALSVVVVLLILANLGTMREVVVLRSELASFAQLVTLPPRPHWLEDDPFPDVLSKFHKQCVGEHGMPLLLVFFESGCPTCRTLVSRLRDSRLAATSLNALIFIFAHIHLS